MAQSTSFSPLAVTVPQNFLGRDFVIGDLHGCFKDVDRALRCVDFSPSVDRLFLVGDLINRGDESAKVGEFLARKSVFAISGNHERALIHLADSGALDSPSEATQKLVASLGMQWWFSASPGQRTDALKAIRALPVAMETMTERGLVGFVHAEVPVGFGWRGFFAAISNDDPQMVDSALYGRTRDRSHDASGVPGVGRVFCGHSIHWGGVRVLGNVVGIDTGAVYAEKLRSKSRPGRLTLVNVVSQLYRQPTSPKHCIDIHDDPSSEPFAAYGSCGARKAKKEPRSFFGVSSSVPTDDAGDAARTISNLPSVLTLQP